MELPVLRGDRQRERESRSLLLRKNSLFLDLHSFGLPDFLASLEHTHTHRVCACRIGAKVILLLFDLANREIGKCEASNESLVKRRATFEGTFGN